MNGLIEIGKLCPQILEMQKQRLQQWIDDYLEIPLHRWTTHMKVDYANNLGQLALVERAIRESK